MKKAHYRCLECEFEWFGKPEPVTCPKCGCIWVKWVNYTDD